MVQEGGSPPLQPLGEIRSDDHRETISGFGNTVAIRDIDHENSVTFNSLFQKPGQVRVVRVSSVFVYVRWNGRARFQDRQEGEPRLQFPITVS